MASLFRNVARSNFVNFLEVFNITWSLVSVGKTFMRGWDNVIRVTSHLCWTIDPYRRKWCHKQSGNSIICFKSRQSWNSPSKWWKETFQRQRKSKYTTLEGSNVAVGKTVKTTPRFHVWKYLSISFLIIWQRLNNFTEENWEWANMTKLQPCSWMPWTGKKKMKNETW